MKRSFPTNVDGQIFYMDEDAFNLLQNYLHQLKVAFKGTDGEEIVGDIESRIRELFAEKIAGGAAVIIIDDVQNVIERMGTPEDITDETVYTDTDAEAEPKADAPTPPPLHDKAPSSSRTISFSIPSNGKKLYRNPRDHVFGGVFGGLAVYLGWNANIMRLLYTVLTICTYFVPFVVIYLIAWMIIPEARTPRQKLQMQGEPVNVGTVGETVIRDSVVTPPPVDEDKNESSLGSILRVLGNCAAGLFGIIAGIVVVSAIVVLIVLATGAVAISFFQEPTILNAISNYDISWAYPATMACAFALALIIFGGILWGCCSILFNAPKASKGTIMASVIASIILIAALVVLCTSFL